MKKLLATFALVIGAVLALPGPSQAQLVLYDDFSGGRIDPAKWHGKEEERGADAPTTETSRTIESKQLQLLLTSFGQTTSNTGFPLGRARQSLQINDPTLYTTIEARVTVTQAAVEDCAANTSTGTAIAGIVASFFNDGTWPGTNSDQTGDIRAQIAKQRDSAGANKIRALVFRCSDAGCDTQSVVDVFEFSTGWALKKADTLKLEWDAPGDRFIFTVNDVESTVISYSYSDNGSPAVNFRQLVVRNTPENCVAETRSASMTARFDNVMVNP